MIIRVYYMYYVYILYKWYIFILTIKQDTKEVYFC